MKGKLIKKLCAVSLSALMLTGAGVAEIGSFISTSLPVSAATAETPASSFEYEINDEGGITIKEFTGSETKIIIPSKIDGIRVTKIGGGAFRRYAELTSVTVPNGVTEIGAYAFKDCTSLTSVTVPNSVTYIGRYAFCDCSELTNIKIPDSVTTIESFAFNGCTGLTSITIPDNVTEIGYHAFYDCSGLTSITFPDRMTEIGSDAFGNCTSLATITIPDSVMTIGGFAFYNTAWYNNKPDGNIYAGKCYYSYKGTMPDNTRIIIKDGTKCIAGAAFWGCTGLTSITLPDSVTGIGENAFYDCTSLTNITLPSSVTSIGNGAFYRCTGLTIQGKKGSYAQIYANENNIPFEAISFLLTNDSNISADTLLLGKTLTVSCNALYDKAPYKYAVWYQNPNNLKWYKAQDYSANATVTVKPKQTGAYIIRVNVKDANGKIKKKDFTVNVFAGLKNTSSVSAAEIKKGKSVTVTAASTGGLGKKQYAVWYKNPNNGKWYKAQGYSAKSTVTVKPKQTGKYIIRVNVKDERGKVVKKDYTVTVKK